MFTVPLIAGIVLLAGVIVGGVVALVAHVFDGRGNFNLADEDTKARFARKRHERSVALNTGLLGGVGTAAMVMLVGALCAL